ncbi:MAG: hypothetical protein WB341_17285 [Terracidiphilus sp.]
MLKPKESLRIFIDAPGQEGVAAVKTMTRRQVMREWKTQDAGYARRDVYSAALGPFAVAKGAIEYYATVVGTAAARTDQPQAPTDVYTLKILA